jgi:hypothetical protein
MKDLIKKILKEETEEVLVIPSLSIFPDGIEGLKNFIQKKNITRWSLLDDLDLYKYKGDLTWLEGLVSISGSLDLYELPIESLGNLQSVDSYLNLYGTQIKSFGNLKSVGISLYLNKFLADKYTNEEIRSMINIGGSINRSYH